jgi:Alpha/beta hydrolase family
MLSGDGYGVVVRRVGRVRRSDGGRFYNECDIGEASEAARRLRPTAATCLAVATDAEPWRSIPSTYVLSARDRAIHRDFQRWMSTRAGEVVTLETDHSPFMSLPEQFADLLDRIADNANEDVARPTC